MIRGGGVKQIPYPFKAGCENATGVIAIKYPVHLHISIISISSEIKKNTIYFATCN